MCSVACLVGFFYFFFHHQQFRSECFLLLIFSLRCLLFTNTCRSGRNGAKMWKTSWYILVMPCRQPHGVIELPPNSSARSYYPPSKMEIESIRVHQIGSALLLLMPSRHRIIPQRIAGYVWKKSFLFFIFQSSAHFFRQSSDFMEGDQLLLLWGSWRRSVVFIQRNFLIPSSV